MSNLRACGPLAYTNNEHAKQLLYALHDHVCCMKIIVLKEFANFATLDTKKCLANLSLMNYLAKVILIMMFPIQVKL
jgi:hypothetical protein